MTRPRIPSFIRNLMDRNYAERLFYSYLDNDEFDDVVDRQVQSVLLRHRWSQYIKPWIVLTKSAWRIVNLGWEILNGRYWKSTKEIRSGAAQASSGGPGASSYSAPVIQSYAGPSPSYVAAAGTYVTGSGAFEDAGIRAGEVVAYRCWVLRDGLLYSAYRSEFAWEPGKIAEGNSAKFSEGIHGFKDRLSACQYLNWFDKEVIAVSGTVELWGDVFEHERGYRASKAAIASIDDSPNYDAAVLRKLYMLNRKKKRKAEKEKDK